MSLSTFKFDLMTKKNLSHADLIIDSHLSWKKASGVKPCWHELFNSIMIAYDSLISNRSQFRQFGPSTPKGLELPFDVPVQVAFLDCPFEYGREVVLKGFNDVLVSTAKWVTASGIAIQWRFVDTEHDRIDLMDYVWDSRYYIWDVGEKSAPVLKATWQARTFIG